MNLSKNILIIGQLSGIRQDKKGGLYKQAIVKMGLKKSVKKQELWPNLFEF